MKIEDQADKEFYNNSFMYGLSTEIMSVIAKNKKLEQYTLNGLNLNINSSAGIFSISSNNALVSDYNYNSTNLKLSITSTSSADALGSTGINSILVVGVDSNYDKVQEVINLNGTSQVLSTNNFQFVNRVVPVVKGSNFMAVGNIVCNASNNTNKHFTILANYDSPYINRFIVPRNYTAIIDSLIFSNNTNDQTLVSVLLKTPNSPLFVGLSSLLFEGVLSYNDKSFTSLPEKNIFVLGAQRLTNNNTSISVNLRYSLIKNSDIPFQLI